MQNDGYTRIKRFYCLLMCTTFALGTHQVAVAASNEPPVVTEAKVAAPVTITGRVIDELGDPLPGVTIAIEGSLLYRNGNTSHTGKRL